MDETGDYIEWIRHPCGLVHTEKYGTLFNVRRSGPYEAPQVDFTYGRGVVPPQPQPVSIGPPSLLNSVWGYIATQGMTGDQVDILREYGFVLLSVCAIVRSAQSVSCCWHEDHVLFE